MPLRLSGGNSPRRAARCWIDEGGVMGTTTQKMTDEQQRGAFARRQFLKASGVLVVGFSIAPWEKLAAAAEGVTFADYPEFDLADVDSFLEVHGDGSVLIKIGKINNGQGTPTSWVMIAADELDVPLHRVQVRFGDTAATPDQGGTGGSNGVASVYNPLRQACATARQALLDMGAAKLDTVAATLSVKDGMIAAGNGGTVSYAELICDQKFNVKFSNSAPVKDPSQFRVIGKVQPQRPEIDKIVTGKMEFTQDVSLPGMLHARSVRPTVAGATLVSIDGFAGGTPPGLVKVLSKGNYVAVV